MPDDVRPPEKGPIAPNLRLLRILEEVARAGTPVSPGALSTALGLPTATVHRLLATAEENGFLQRDIDGRSYSLGQRTRSMAGNILSSERVRTERLLIMKTLAEKVGETCNLAAPDRYGMVYVDRVETHWPLRIQLAIGTQVPFHCTASGKMYLSSLRSDKLNRILSWLDLEQHTEHSIGDKDHLINELALTRQRNYATDNQEFMVGMSAIAVPIRDSENRLLSTLSIHAPIQRQTLDVLITKLSELQNAAHRIEELYLSD